MSDFQIIVVAPTGRDGRLICDLLARNGFEAVQCSDCESASRHAKEGVGAFLIADEVLTASGSDVLSYFMENEPSWSDPPVIVLTCGGQSTLASEKQQELREPLGNVLLVERPVRPETLTSTVQGAIRARRRQYEVREHLRLEKLAAEALRKSEKLVIVGRLAASIAHEINNPLAAVTNLHYLIANSTSLDEAKAFLTLADEELARVVEITTHTLRFHRESSTPAEVKVVDILDSVLKLYERRMMSSRIVVNQCFDRSVRIMGFAGELRQLVANLISNAVDAMHAGGTLRVRLMAAAERSNGVRPGIRVVVADTGSGIPASVRGKLFEPFVTTKVNTGTGLGLWVSAEIVRKHGGVLRYKSQLGRGTVFSVFLPLQLPPGPQPDNSLNAAA